MSSMQHVLYTYFPHHRKTTLRGPNRTNCLLPSPGFIRQPAQYACLEPSRRIGRVGIVNWDINTILHWVTCLIQVGYKAANSHYGGRRPIWTDYFKCVYKFTNYIKANAYNVIEIPYNPWPVLWCSRGTALFSRGYHPRQPERWWLSWCNNGRQYLTRYMPQGLTFRLMM